MSIQINPQNFDQVVSGGKIALIDCWAPWCRNCDDFARSFERVAAKHPDHTFATLNTQEQPEMRAKIGIEHIPSLLLFRDGILLFSQPGNFDEATLESIVAQAESIDMDEVRAHIAREQASRESP